MATHTESVAAAVRDALAARGIRQAAVAAVLGLSQPSVSDRLRGKTPFTLVDLYELADLLCIDVTDLLMPRVVEDVPA